MAKCAAFARKLRAPGLLSGLWGTQDIKQPALSSSESGNGKLLGRFRKSHCSPKQPVSMNDADLDARLRWKIETLRQMCRNGIWLLDAAVHAIYLGNKKRLPIETQRTLHQQWWNGYGRHLINSCGEMKIWVIGKTVFNCLTVLPNWRCQGWVYQPNHNTETNWSDLLNDCHK